MMRYFLVITVKTFFFFKSIFINIIHVIRERDNFYVMEFNLFFQFPSYKGTYNHNGSILTLVFFFEVCTLHMLVWQLPWRCTSGVVGTQNMNQLSRVRVYWKYRISKLRIWISNVHMIGNRLIADMWYPRISHLTIS